MGGQEGALGGLWTRVMEALQQLDVRDREVGCSRGLPLMNLGPSLFIEGVVGVPGGADPSVEFRSPWRKAVAPTRGVQRAIQRAETRERVECDDSLFIPMVQWRGRSSSRLQIILGRCGMQIVFSPLTYRFCAFSRR